MVKFTRFAGIVAVTALMAACSGGGEGEKTEETTQAAAPAADAPATADAAATPAAAPAPAAPSATDVATVDGKALASFTGDAAAGKMVFAQCGACHSLDAGVNKVGPSLHGVVGSKAGAVAGFSYSTANSGSGITWTKEKLFQYIENPKRVVPGTKMAFGGIADAQKRADLIAFLENPS